MGELLSIYSGGRIATVQSTPLAHIRVVPGDAGDIVICSWKDNALYILPREKITNILFGTVAP